MPEKRSCKNLIVFLPKYKQPTTGGSYLWLDAEIAFLPKYQQPTTHNRQPPHRIDFCTIISDNIYTICRIFLVILHPKTNRKPKLNLI